MSPVGAATPTSGAQIDVTYAVTNISSDRGRDTRETSWTDRIFLSRDESLDSKDLLLGKATRQGMLDQGDSYQKTVTVRLPDSIEGTFHLLVFADSAASLDQYTTSDIGFGLKGIQIEPNNPLNVFDLASAAQRSLGRGTVTSIRKKATTLRS